MPTSIMQKNYSKCPLKKRPVYFTFDESEVCEEPENLSIKKEYTPEPEIIADAEEPQKSPQKTSVIIPTPTYPKLNLQPWSFHIPYATDFYRNYHHSHQGISPLRSDLHSPNSPSEGSISPPPHYLNGRASSVSPPICDSICRPILLKPPSNSGTHIIKPEIVPQHRYLPYQIPYHQPYALGLGQPPVSPTYSDSSSYYSLRSQTPETNSLVPEDLSVKHSIPHNSYVKTEIKREKVKPFVDSAQEKSAPPRYQCPDCSKSYSTFSGLTKHQQFHCPAAEGNQVKKSFSCKDCDKTYVSLGALKMHIRTHTLPCKCTICGKAFSRPWLLQGHIRTHTGEKPFSCQHCHRAFADRSNLRAHLQTHSDIKKYSCSTCSKTFSRMSLLTKHTEGGCPGVQVSSTTSPYLSSFQEH